MITLQVGAAARPKSNDVYVLPSTPRPATNPASPPRVIPLQRATPLQVSLFPRVAPDRLTAQAPNTTPHQKVPTTSTASRGPLPHRSTRPLDAAITALPPTTTPQRRPTRLAVLRANLADRDEQNATCRARHLHHTPLPPTEPLEGPAMQTRSRTHAADPPTGTAMHTRSKTFNTMKETMFSCFHTRQPAI